jgi:RHS repeat-associated protein
MQRVERTNITYALVLLFFALLGTVVPITIAQGGSKDDPKKFGAHQEIFSVLTVPVQGGDITVSYSWQGDKKRWSVDPHREPLVLSTAKQGSAYGYDLPKEINRGASVFTQAYAGVWRRNFKQAVAVNVPSAVAQAVFVNNFQYCKNDGEEASETIYAAKDGFKWTSGASRNWAQYNPQGVLVAWGQGNFLIAKVLYDPQGRIRGYADTLDTEVVTFERDPQGRVIKVKDYGGREFQATYNAEGLIENTIDIDGVKTHYAYLGGNITSKTIGDDTNSSPDQAVNDETTIMLTYFSDNILQSIKTLDGTEIKYQYDYIKEGELYIVSEIANGNQVTKTIRSGADGAVSTEKNGQYLQRVFNLCEDTAIVDQHNALTYVDRDGFGMVTALLRPDGKKITVQYAAQSWPEVQDSWNAVTKPWGITSVTFPDGRTISYEQDAKGKAKKVIKQDLSGEKRQWEYTYDPYGNTTEERLLAGATPNDTLDYVERWTYDSYGNIKTFQSGINGPLWQYQYNSHGDLTTVTAPDGEKFLYTYTPSGKLKTFTDPVGYKVTAHYTQRGLLKLIEDTYEIGKNAISKYHYNHRGLVTKVIDPFAKEWIFEHNANGEIEAEIDPLGKKVSYTYDVKNRLAAFTDGNGVTVSYQYLDTAPPGQAPQTELAFAPRVLIQYPTLTQDLQYDLLGNLTIERFSPKDGSPVEEMFYEKDLYGRLSAVTRPDGEKTELTWDILDQLTSIAAPDQGLTKLSYIEANRKLTYTDAINGSSIYELDQSGRLKKQTGVDGKIVVYTYDVNGNLATVTGGKGEFIKFFYDKAQQREKVEVYANTSAPTPIRTVNYTRNLRGDVTDVVDGVVTQHYDLDAIGRVLTATTTYDGGFSKSHSYTYTANGFPQTLTMIDGTQISYLWDAANQLTGVTIQNQGTINVGYTSLEWPQPVSITFPGGSKQQYEYDNLRRTKRIHSTDQVGNTLLDYKYSFESGPFFGGVVKELDTEHGQYTFDYDKAARLTDVTYPNLTEESYTYDDLGRRQTVGHAPWTYTASGAVTSGGGAQYTYDNGGNRKTKTVGGVTSEYFYDEGDKLTRIEKPLGTLVAKYTHDVFGRRLSKEVGGVKTYFYYDENGLAAELDATGAVMRKYLFPPETPWSTAPLAIAEGNNYHFSHNDVLGTPQKFVNAGGAVTWQGRAKAFGETDVLSSTFSNPLRMPGQYFDAESSLHHNLHRNYDPAIGAYLEQDPFDLLATGANRYLYAQANPLTFFDPTGQYSLSEFAGDVETASEYVGLAATLTAIVVSSSAASPFLLTVAATTTAVSTGFEVYNCYQNVCLKVGTCLSAIASSVGALKSGKALFGALKKVQKFNKKTFFKGMKVPPLASFKKWKKWKEIGSTLTEHYGQKGLVNILDNFAIVFKPDGSAAPSNALP